MALAGDIADIDCQAVGRSTRLHFSCRPEANVAQIQTGWVSGMTDSLSNTEAPLEWVDDAGPYRVISKALTAANVDLQAVRSFTRGCVALPIPVL